MRTSHMVGSPILSNFVFLKNRKKWSPLPLLVLVRESIRTRIIWTVHGDDMAIVGPTRRPTIKTLPWSPEVKSRNSGLIGRSYAMIFASAGFNVKLYDIAQNQVKAALEDIASQLKILEKDGLIRGNLSVGILWLKR